MTTVVLFHHALGVTPSLFSIAKELRRNGHEVYLPDLFGGRVFDTIPQGVAYAQHIGFAVIAERARTLVEELPTAVVYAGISLGVLCAQMLAQTREGALGAFLISAAMPHRDYSEHWPAHVRLEVHAGSRDEFFEEDRPAAEALIADAENAELVRHPGASHLFAEEGHQDYHAGAAHVMLDRFETFLLTVGSPGKRTGRGPVRI